jgi:transcription antitermination factor NusG
MLLEHKGYDVFFPKCWFPTPRGSKLLEAALFPGYLFCRAITSTYGLIVTTPGVRGIVSFNKQPAAVPETEIQNIRLLIRPKLPLCQWPSFEAGNEIELISGPLIGCRGVVKQQAEEHYLIVSLHILQRSIAVKVETEWIRPLAARRPASSALCAAIAKVG